MVGLRTGLVWSGLVRPWSPGRWLEVLVCGDGFARWPKGARQLEGENVWYTTTALFHVSTRDTGLDRNGPDGGGVWN